MANLANRENVFQDLFDFRRDFDHIFNRMLSGRSGSQQQGVWGAQSFLPAVDAYVDKEGKRFICNVALPGVDPKDINISVQGNVLSISGERKFSEEKRDANIVHQEMTYGAFQRDIMLPEGVEADKISAECRNGQIEITAPISAAALPRRIEVKGTSTSKQMAAGR